MEKEQKQVHTVCHREEEKDHYVMWSKNNIEFRWEEFEARDTTTKIAHGRELDFPGNKKNKSCSQLDLSIKGQSDHPDHRATERGKAQKCKSTLRNTVVRRKPKQMKLGNGKSTKDKETVEPPVWMAFPDFVRTRITPLRIRSVSVKESESENEVAQSCPTLCKPMDCSLPGSFLHGILQARILEWVATSFSRRSSRPRDQTLVSRVAGRCFNLWATREALSQRKCFFNSIPMFLGSLLWAFITELMALYFV